MKRTASVFAFVAFSVLLLGCSTTLAPGGVYSNDSWIYGIDSAIKMQQRALQAFVAWEYQNHPAIKAQWPDVSAAANNVRREAPVWFDKVTIVRRQYLAIRSIYTSRPESPELASARSKVSDAVVSIDKQISIVQANVNATTLPSKPTFK